MPGLPGEAERDLARSKFLVDSSQHPAGAQGIKYTPWLRQSIVIGSYRREPFAAPPSLDRCCTHAVSQGAMATSKAFWIINLTLGYPGSSQAKHVRQAKNWGGAIELSVLAEHFQCEPCLQSEDLWYAEHELGHDRRLQPTTFAPCGAICTVRTRLIQQIVRCHEGSWACAGLA